MTKHKCQMTMDTKGGYDTNYFECGKPAKAWINDCFKRVGWGGKQYLCGIHARAHDRIAVRYGRQLSAPIEPETGP